VAQSPSQRATFSLRVPDTEPLERIGAAALARVVREGLIAPHLALGRIVGRLRRGDTLEIHAAPPPPADDLVGAVVHHAQLMTIAALRMELAWQGISVACSARAPGITVPGRAGTGQPPDYWSDKPILVTGASSGMGRGLAEELVRRGARVHGLARRTMAPEGVAGGGHLVPLRADVTDLDALRAALAERRFFAIFHSAASASIGLLHTRTEPSVVRDITTDVLGTLHVAKLAGTSLERGGHLVIVSSGAAKVPWLGGVCYVAAKAAQHKTAERLSSRLAPGRVAVTCVLAGAFASAVFSGKTEHAALDRLISASSRAFLPGAQRVARQVLADAEHRRPESTAGITGATAHGMSGLVTAGLERLPHPRLLTVPFQDRIVRLAFRLGRFRQ
jgi:NAD(P)-dependent dehydrogenase (short-subunit alcohol dehydrogenase family)